VLQTARCCKCGGDLHVICIPSNNSSSVAALIMVYSKQHYESREPNSQAYRRVPARLCDGWHHSSHLCISEAPEHRVQQDRVQVVHLQEAQVVTNVCCMVLNACPGQAAVGCCSRLYTCILISRR
jgi:hypothetical protein